MTLVDLECGTCGLRWSGRPGAPCPVGHTKRPPDRESEIIAEIVRLKHGPNGTGQRGSCDRDCAKCALEKELEEVRAARGSETAAPPRTTDGDTPGANRIAALETALRSLIARVRRTGGYASPEEQAALWEAERVLGGGA